MIYDYKFEVFEGKKKVFGFSVALDEQVSNLQVFQIKKLLKELSNISFQKFRKLRFLM